MLRILLLILASYGTRVNYQPANTHKRVQPQRVQSLQTTKETEFGDCIQMPALPKPPDE